MWKKALPFLFLFVLVALLHTYVQLQPENDDAFFSQVSQKYTLPDYLSFRYQNWTGRMSAEGLIYLFFRPDLRVWKLINPLVVTLLAVCLAFLLYGPSLVRENSPGMIRTLWFLCLGIGLIHSGILLPAVFWASGSFFYLWPAAAGAAALIPFRWKVLPTTVRPPVLALALQVLFWLAGFIACTSSEQMALVCLGLGTLATAWDWRQNRRLNLWLIIPLLVMAAGAAVLFLAPGNALRYEAEIQQWYPKFREQSFAEHAYIGLAWMMDKLLNKSRPLLGLMYLFLAAITYFLHSKSSSRYRRVLAAALLDIAVLLAITSLNQDILQGGGRRLLDSLLYTFPTLKEIRQPPGSNMELLKRFLPYAVWLPVMALTPLWLALAGRPAAAHLAGPPSGDQPGPAASEAENGLGGGVLAILFGFGLASLGAITSSPTIFASGNRVAFVFSVVVLFIAAALFSRLAARLPRPLLAAIYLLPILNWTMLFVDLRYAGLGILP